MRLSQTLAFEKLKHYCSYQDRCHQEVRYKLIALKIYGDDLEEVISELIQADYLNEERFAQSYARGKFRMKKWGRIKITIGLKQKRVSAYCIKKGLEEIEEEDYEATLKSVLQKSLKNNQNLDQKAAKNKAIKYAYSRGYEYPIISRIILDIEEDQ